MERTNIIPKLSLSRVESIEATECTLYPGQICCLQSGNIFLNENRVKSFCYYNLGRMVFLNEKGGRRDFCSAYLGRIVFLNENGGRRDFCSAN